MSNPVEFRIAISNSFPSGTGSFNYKGSFEIVVENLAFAKQVSIFAQVGTIWREIPATFVESLPENRERWQAPATNGEQQFVAKYSVNGETFFDNNAGANYIFPQAFDDFLVLTGRQYPIVLGTASIASGTLHIFAAVQDLAFAKVVGVIYTTDHWATAHTTLGSFDHAMPSGMQVWKIDASLSGAASAEFALFYQVLGQQFFDNNFFRNYTA